MWAQKSCSCKGRMCNAPVQFTLKNRSPRSVLPCSKGKNFRNLPAQSPRALATVIPFYSNCSAQRVSAALKFFSCDEISGRSVDRVLLRSNLAHWVSIEPGFERFACHGSGGSEPSAGRRRREGCFRSSSRIHRKYRHLPPPPTPTSLSPPACCLSVIRPSRTRWCLRKNTEPTIDRGDAENHSSAAGTDRFAQTTSWTNAALTRRRSPVAIKGP